MGQVAERERRAVTLYAEGIISSGGHVWIQLETAWEFSKQLEMLSLFSAIFISIVHPL